MIYKIKNYSTDKTCDIFLRRLYRLEEKKKRPEFLNHILDKKRVYYDQSTIDNVLNKLLEKGFIENASGELIFSYEKKEPIKSKKGTAPLSEGFVADFIKNIDGRVSLYQLTNKGRNFVINDQIFDEKGKEIRKAKIEKWIDRIFAFITGIATTLLATWLIDKIFK